MRSCASELACDMRILGGSEQLFRLRQLRWRIFGDKQLERFLCRHGLLQLFLTGCNINSKSVL